MRQDSYRRVRVSAVAMGTVIVAALVFWVWGMPRSALAMPNRDTSPTQVVRTYVLALDSRDFAVSNALQPYGSAEHWWTPDAPTITDLHVTGVGRIGPGARLDIAGSARWKQGVNVDTTADFTNFSGMNNGTTGWSYALVGNSNSQPWRILDWGQG